MRKIYISFLITLACAITATNQATAQCSQNFDGVVAPALPTGWTSDVTGAGVAWITSTTNSFSAPNNSFGTETSVVGVTNYNSQIFPITSPTAQLTFRNLFNLEDGFDGMVLEIAIGAGPFQDILVAGGSFVTGGYTDVLSVNFSNPLPGRNAWSGLSGGSTAAPTYINTIVNLPAGAAGQNVQFRWRVGSDASLIAAGAAGTRIDDIAVTGCAGPVVPCTENFDAVTAPAIPPSWTASATGVGVAWVTSTTTPASAPNAAFAPDVSNIGTSTLTSRIFPITSAAAVMTFSNLYNLEDNFDGMVLEISIGGGAYADILAAGGTFGTGGYNDVISTTFGSPIGGRLAWNGLSAGTTAAPTYITTTVNLPAAANGQNVQFRWIVATDNSLIAPGAAGARIDNISITGSNCGSDCSGTPTAGAISGTNYSCAGTSVNLTLSGQTTLPGIVLQWQSASVSGGPYTNIPGATGTSYNFPATAGTTYYVVRVTCANGGAFVTTAEHSVTVGAPVHSLVSSTITTVCSPGAATITGTASGGVMNTVYGTSGNIALDVPDNVPAGVNSTINLPGAVFVNAADLSIRINARHSWTGDLIFRLTSPCGATFLFDRPGVPVGLFGNSDNLGTSSASTPPPAVYTFALSAATVLPEASTPAGFIPTGSYLPSNTAGASHTWAGVTFPCNSAGNWVLNISDNAGGDVGQLVDWQILGPAVYTHTLTGPGTIVQNASTGANNSTANFTVTNIPFGPQTYTLTSRDVIGCTVSSPVTVLIKQTPVITFTQTPANPVCRDTVQTISVNVVPPIFQSFNQIATTIVPAGSPAATSGIADPYPSTLLVSGIPNGATVKSVRLGNVNHTFPDDMDIVLVSPNGAQVVLVSDVGGGTDAVVADWVLDDAAASLMSDGALNPDGTYKPTNIGASDTWVAPGPLTLNQPTPTLSSFGSTGHNGTWRLYIVDDAGGDLGYVGNWGITFSIPPTVVFSPTTGLFTNPAATIPYTGTPVTVVYAKPAITTTYTATATIDGCTGTNTVTVVVNQPPAITVQPLPATQAICPGYNVVYTVTATGTGITYQWRRNGVNLVNNAQISGVTTNTLTITAVTAANAGTYTVVVTGACPNQLTSNNAVLEIGSTPVISAQPANRTVCVGQNAAFTVGTAGSVPPPTGFQWQMSPDGVAPFVNLTDGGSYTATYTLANAQLTDNGRRYRVIITNACGQTITSGVAILTVVANPVVTAAILPKICLSDTLITLVGTPIGGSWSGIGVSGFNFVPGATAVGTYTLTYTYTNANGCTATATTIAKVEDCQERIRLLSKDGLILYPNPNNGVFNVKMNSTLYSYLGMHVYTTSGQLVKSQTWGGLVFGRVVPIDLSHLPSATYMVKFFYDDGARTSEKTFPVVINTN